jgi:hypothetical protein
LHFLGSILSFFFFEVPFQRFPLRWLNGQMSFWLSDPFPIRA